MSFDPYLTRSPETPSRSGKTGWGTGALLTAGFVAGCLVSRTRFGKSGLLMLAGGLVWEMVRPRQPQRVYRREPVLDLCESSFANTDRAFLEAPAAHAIDVEPARSLDENAAAEIPFSTLLSYAEPERVRIEPEVSVVNEPKPATEPLTPFDLLRPVRAEALLRKDTPTQPIFEPLAPITAPLVSEESPPQQPVFEPLAAIESLVPDPEPVASVVVKERVEPEPVAEVAAGESPMVVESAPVEAIVVEALLPERLEVPSLENVEVVTVPMHLDAGDSAAWLLGMEPIPLVEEEPAWRKPLLAGIQSAFEPSPAVTAMPPEHAVAAGATIPDEVQIPVSVVEEPAAEPVALPKNKPSTQSLLGRLLEAGSLAVKTVEASSPAESSESTPTTAATIREPIDVPAQPAEERPAMWLAEELRDNKRRAPALAPLPATVNEHAAAIAAASPARRLPAMAGDAQKKKSWLGLWK